MKRLVQIILAAVFILSCTVALIVNNEYNSRDTAANTLNNYGKYLQFPLWELNKRSAEIYVNVISKAENYKQFDITLIDGEKYISYKPDSKLKWYKYFFELLSQEVPFEMKVMHYGRHIATINAVWVSYTAYTYLYIIICIILILVMIYFYITSSKKRIKEANKEASVRRHQLLVDTIPHGILELDSYGAVNYVNPAYLKMVGYEEKEIIDKGIIFPSFKEAQKTSSILRIIRDNRPSPFPIFFRHKTRYGTVIDVQMDWSYNFDEHKKLEGFICAITNITERKKAENTLKQTKLQAEKANEAKSEFLANISHEIRTPMHSILSFSSFGIKKIETSPLEKLKHYFESIHDSADRLMMLLNDLLDLSKLEAGKMIYDYQPNDIRIICHKIITEMSSRLEQRNIEVMVRDTEIRTSLKFDKEKIGQVIRNLVSNAFKFSEPNSKIFIYFETDYTNVNDNVQITLKVNVEDYGIGIPEEEREHIFDKFIQSSKTKTGAGGTGLGLSICKEIIENHNGSIWVKNKTGSTGCIFSFTIPYEL